MFNTIIASEHQKHFTDTNAIIINIVHDKTDLPLLYAKIRILNSISINFETPVVIFFFLKYKQEDNRVNWSLSL